VDRYAQVVETGEPLLLDDEPFTNLDDGVEHRFDNRAVKVGDGISFTWRDVTASFNSRKALRERSERDGLTGVANRRRLEERLRELSEQAPRTGTNLAVLFCDLDHFKEINDEFGHVAGDAVLTAVAQRISSAVREGDLVARVGGDEFVVVLPGMHSLDDALAVASKVATAVQRPLTLGDTTVHVQASVGVALSSDGDDPADVLSEADAAMYEAKRTGRNRIVSATSE
jgi:diguanylate cyclase (GGDEF)-like protein